VFLAYELSAVHQRVIRDDEIKGCGACRASYGEKYLNKHDALVWFYLSISEVISSSKLIQKFHNNIRLAIVVG